MQIQMQRNHIYILVTNIFQWITSSSSLLSSTRMISWRAWGGLLSKTETIVCGTVDLGFFLFWFCHRAGGDENCDDGDKGEDVDGDGDSWHSIIEPKRWQSPPIRVEEFGSLSPGTKMAMKIFVKRVFTTFATTASFLRLIANLQYATYTM